MSGKVMRISGTGDESDALDDETELMLSGEPKISFSETVVVSRTSFGCCEAGEATMAELRLLRLPERVFGRDDKMVWTRPESIDCRDRRRARIAHMSDMTRIPKTTRAMAAINTPLTAAGIVLVDLACVVSRRTNSTGRTGIFVMLINSCVGGDERSP